MLKDNFNFYIIIFPASAIVDQITEIHALHQFELSDNICQFGYHSGDRFPSRRSGVVRRIFAYRTFSTYIEEL